MTCQIWITFVINFIAGLLIFLLGLSWPNIPKSFRKSCIRKFWGKGVFGQDFVIAYGALIDSRHRNQDKPIYWYDKYYHDGTFIPTVGPRTNIVSAGEIRSASYIINLISAYRKGNIVVMDDATLFPSLNRTFVAFGSPSSNEISRLILNEPNNIFLEFKQEEDNYFIHNKQTKKEFIGFKENIKKDYGIILKIPNSRFPGHFFFVCAGLGEWGTSGSSWYLANHWKDLRSEFGGDAFGIVVEVDIGCDESALRADLVKEN